MNTFLLVLVSIALGAELIIWGEKLPQMSIQTWLILGGACAVVSFLEWSRRVIARALNRPQRSTNRGAPARKSQPTQNGGTIMSPVSNSSPSAEKKAVAPKKVLLIAGIAFLVFFACGGTWAVQNAVTILLVAAPIGLFFGVRNYAKANNDTALYAALALAGVELVAWLFGGLDGVYQRVAIMGGELQCLSLIALIVVGAWFFNKQTNFLGRWLEEQGVDTKATAVELKKAGQETAKAASDWLTK